MRIKRLAALAGALSLTLSLTACGSSDSDTPEANTDSTASVPAPSGFPVTIEHKFGSTTITKAPQRIVTVGLTDQDAVLALGKVPVATTQWFGKAPGRIFEWADDLLGDTALPVVLDDEKQFDKVNSLKPDLITAVYAGITQEDYDKLSKIAPVVAAPKEYVDYGTPWQEATTLIGTAMGQKATAEKIVADVEGQLAAAAAAHPEFKGQTAATVSAYEGIFIYGEEDPRTRFLTSLGFTFPEDVKKLFTKSFGGSISAENAEKVDLDALVWVNGEDETDKAAPVYKNLRVAKEGRGVFIEGNEEDPLYIGSSFVTALSIPFLIEKLVPRLSAAVDGDVATATD